MTISQAPFLLIGLNGRAGAGKDTVAAHLHRRWNILPFSFSDALYEEVAMAFDVDTDDVLLDRSKKEEPSELLTAARCKDPAFADLLMHKHGHTFNEDLSPRQVLQLWGTEYRRAQDPLYWIKKAEKHFLWVRDEYQPVAGTNYLGMVNTSTRFPNEAEWVGSMKCPLTKVHGQVWEVERTHPYFVKGYAKELGTTGAASHVSEVALPRQMIDAVIVNDSTLAALHAKVDEHMRVLLHRAGLDPDKM